jgi:spermidine/putrescine-binding protein
MFALYNKGEEKMRRLFVFAICFLFVLGVLSAQDKVLRIVAPPWAFTKTPLEECAKKFEAAHPGVKVELTRIDKWQVPAFIAEWQTGKSSFDLGITGTGSMLAPVIVGNWIDPLDDLYTGNMSKDKIVTSFFNEGAFKDKNGKTFYPLIPFVGEASIIGANTEILKKSGLMKGNTPVGIPSFNDKDFYAWFNKIKPNAPVGAAVFPWDKEFMQYDYLAPILAMSGTFLSKDGKGFDVTSPSAKKWLGQLQKLNKDGLGSYTISIDAAIEKWKTGAAGIMFAAQSHAQELVNIPGRQESNLAYIAWPGAEKNGTIIWSHSAWVPKLATQKDLAKAFIKEQIFSIYWQQWTWNHYGKLPVLKEAYGKGITRFANQMPTLLKIAESSKSIPVYTDLQPYLDIMTKYIPEAAYGRMSVDEALKKVQEESAKLDFSDIRAR